MGQNNINTPPPGKLPSFFRLRLPPRQLEMIFLRDNYTLPEGGSLKAATFSSFFYEPQRGEWCLHLGC